MRQVSLLALASRLPPGRSINIMPEEIREAAGGDLSYLDGPPRREDVEWFVAQVNRNWGVSLWENMETGVFTMHKEEDDKERTHKSS